MVKPALGKGMKDLLPKNVGIPVQTGEGSEEELVKKELEINIDRFSAQEFDVEPLRSLKGRSMLDMKNGIELFRDNVKKLSSALTALRSLEGYGYNTEIDSIMKDIKNTQKADDVLRRVEILKERAVSDQGGKGQKVTPRSRILKGLKAASEVLKGSDEERQDESGSPQVADLEGMDVDSLMDDLAQLGSEFSDESEVEADEVERQLLKWQQEGYFVDRLRVLIQNSEGDPTEELERFSKEVGRIEQLKKRLDMIDPTGLKESIKKVRIKLPYTYMATDIEHDIQVLERIDRERKDAARAVQEMAPEPEPEKEVPEDIASEVEEDAEEEPEVAKQAIDEPREVPEPEVEGVQQGTPALETVEDGDAEGGPVMVEEEALEPGQEEKGAEKTDESPDISLIPVEDLLEKAKEAYGEDDLKKAMSLFEEVLKKDPDNSKARFMIRRIGQKM
ncbi:MAG: hypothetical protein QCI82_05615 [Candidatus Thermoplasmatota archaeon]|nr:hypothetical protein [Candidatus Thermoplasmatota archaeon]